jgi:hypothetical protein
MNTLAGRKKLPASASSHFTQKLRQLRDTGRDPPRLTFAEQLGR